MNKPSNTFALIALTAGLVACGPQGNKPSSTREIPSSIQLPGTSKSAPTKNTKAAPVAATTTPKRARPVVPGQPSRVFIMAGFEDDCRPKKTEIRVVTEPLKGTVTFRPGQSTTIKQSKSGKCIGEKIEGTGIYYTAKANVSGSDSFTVAVTLDGKAPVLRSFDVEIASN